MDFGNKKIVDYKLFSAVVDVSAERVMTTKLTSGVKEYIKEGWIPYGTPFVFEDHICQALVKVR